MPVFIPNTKKPRFFMPHFPIFTGNVHSYDPGKVKFLLLKLGNPERRLKNIIHVVGTNGKGSNVAYLKSILTTAGFGVNSYTSPHLYACNERINILGHSILDEKLFYLTEKVRILCEQEVLDITILESLTIVAILAFSATNADFNIFEAGMGGLNDATNVFEDTACVILTSISLDHTKFLGETTYQIAKQKLGVLRSFVPLVLAPCTSDVLLAVLEEVKNHDAKPFFYGKDYNICRLEFEDGVYGIEYAFREKEAVILPLPPLFGEHQIFNLATSLTAINVLDITISEEKLMNGILDTKWPGRLEKIMIPKILDVLPNGSEVWFDGAHNPGGAQALATWLESDMEKYENVLIVSKTKGSDALNFLRAFDGMIKFGIAIKGLGEIFPENPEVLAQSFNLLKIPHFVAQDLTDAFIVCQNQNYSKTLRVLITGSLYLARDIGGCLHKL